jgi:hypothetical protein
MEPEAAPALLGPAQLSPEQQARLAELEGRIAKGLSMFLEVSECLWTIKNERLFRAHGSFENYCQERWGFSAHHASRLLRSLGVVHLLQENGDCPPLPESMPEALMRPLCPLEPPLQVSVWRLANQIADGSPESPVIERLVKAVQHAIDRGVKGENGTDSCRLSSSSSDSHKPPRSNTSGHIDFFTSLLRLASGCSGFSAYLVVHQIDETTAKSHLAACQRVITMCHEAIEQMRMRFPWI